MKKHTIFLAVSLAFTISACSKAPEEEAVEETSAEPLVESVIEEVQTTTIEVTKLADSPAYADASITLLSPEDTSALSSGEVSFEFDVANYEIGAQTDSPNATLLANSGAGQHIHFILNNEPYSAHYETAFAKEIPDGNHHLVAFISRSYHESVKNDNSMVVTQLSVGEAASDEAGYDMDAPTLIYSRPKGTYKGEGTKNILLDFFVLNTELSESGNKVKAVINGSEFIMTEWVPYVVTGLPLGEATFELSLIDADGTPIPGPFNQVTRTVMLTE